MHTIERERQIWLSSDLDWNMVMLYVATVSMKLGIALTSSS